jgi:two-component sensor histidine kinase/integral membrane sensor domain MASE1
VNSTLSSPAAFVAMFIACLAAASTTEIITAVSDAGVSIWLPTGFVMGASIATQKKFWPLWMIAAAGAEATGNLIWYGHAWGPALVLIGGNLAAAFTGALLVRRIVETPYIFANVRNSAAFLAVALLVVPLISATICSMGLSWSYGRPPFTEWPRLFLGDATGVAIAAPLTLLIMGAAAERLRFSGSRPVEAASLLLFLVGFIALSLSSVFPYVFILIVPILWSALRFRIPGAILTTVAIAIASIYLTIADVSPFGPSAIYGRFGSHGLQIFIIIVAAAALLVGAIAEENRAAIRSLRVINRDLEDRVIERSEQLTVSEATGQKTSRLLTAIGEACPDLIFAKNIDRQLIYANPATLVVLDIPPSKLDLGFDTDGLFTNADEAAVVKTNDERVLRNGETIIVEEAVTSRTGERRIFRATKAPLYDSDGSLVGLAGVCVDITDAKKSAARERMLVSEIEHRGRNLLAVLQGIIQLTRAETVPEFQAAISRRLHALARTHGSIVAANWQGASFTTILRDEFASYLDVGDPHIHLSGEDLMLDTATAQSLALIIHELATNAAKYGALSTPVGRVSVNWTVAGEGASARLVLEWQERDGPPVTPPVRTGFGSTIIALLAEERPGGSIDQQWKAEGLMVRLILPLITGDDTAQDATGQS